MIPFLNPLVWFQVVLGATIDMLEDLFAPWVDAQWRHLDRTADWRPVATEENDHEPVDS
jgi:hypothetical protein